MAVDVKKISEKGNVTKLLIKGVDHALINSTRRAIMNAVPTLAIEGVSVYENKSVMFDEFLAHRLGLIPLKTDLKRHDLKDKVKVVLEKEGPCTVYSKDIKISDPKVEVVSKRIPILKLSKDQKIKIEGFAVLGTGKEHSKWQPAIASYRELPEITVRKECNLCKECIKACPAEVLEIKGKKVALKDELNCILCWKCRDACPKDCITLDYSEGSFIFTIDSHGGARASDIMLEAIAGLNEKANEFRKELKKL